MQTALARWNSQQPAWKPVKRWNQLTIDEKVQVCQLECVVYDLDKERQNEILDVASRVGDALAITLATVCERSHR
jgi:hypothetical protein